MVVVGYLDREAEGERDGDEDQHDGEEGEEVGADPGTLIASWKQKSKSQIRRRTSQSTWLVVSA